MKLEVVFVVLTYRNDTDLRDFFSSLKECRNTKRVIVVNAFYDDESLIKIKDVAESNNADFIEIENKGYSYGNNTGIKYAMEHYTFDYLVVSNPDIEIQKFDAKDLKGTDDAVLGPRIRTLNGKNQNPMVYRRVIPAMYIEYLNQRHGDTPWLWGGRVVHKLVRMAALAYSNLNQNKLYRTYMLHGSFVIFPYKLLEKLAPVYDENMFLFAEESYLAERLRNENIKSFYCPAIVVKHKEDGSMQFSRSTNKYMREANIYVYEKYYGFK